MPHWPAPLLPLVHVLLVVPGPAISVTSHFLCVFIARRRSSSIFTLSLTIAAAAFHLDYWSSSGIIGVLQSHHDP
eukprot:CAMPEP_0195605734 /NCGR_PEP_ID=MMETSP0815-20121206/7311_1 /TAXON_ID=97485 /ORGANISM="Prymnesium parvum, Strain Texoma1" /LENGTH=74 /DNA_ID=CAMNT_0040745431 /DNA_START=74 /DNA_END=298 /DNA_ORIENTATION=+